MENHHFFHRKYIFQWWISRRYVSLPECNCWGFLSEKKTPMAPFTGKPLLSPVAFSPPAKEIKLEHVMAPGNGGSQIFPNTQIGMKHAQKSQKHICWKTTTSNIQPTIKKTAETCWALYKCTRDNYSCYFSPFFSRWLAIHLPWASLRAKFLLVMDLEHSFHEILGQPLGEVSPHNVGPMMDL